MTTSYKRPSGVFDLLTRLDGVDLSLAERAVLLAQYKFGDQDGTSSRVGEERLAAYLNIDVRTIRRHRKTLREKGWLIERERGRDTGETKTASLYWVVIPPRRTPVAVKPKRVPNPSGRNQYTGPIGQNCPIALEDKLTKNARSLEDRINHLPEVPKTNDQVVGSNSDYQDPWVAQSQGHG